MQQLNLKGRILFVFSDPGGAKPILSLVENEHLEETLIVSDRQYSFYKDFQSDIVNFEDNIQELIVQFKPEIIFTATSYLSEIEKRFIQTAHQSGIHSISFIDHWTSMKKRFILSDGTLILPDKIAVIDDRAKKIAVSEGIDDSRIIVIGNPYHLWLSKWKPQLTKYQFFESIDINVKNKKIALYAPDPLSNVDGQKQFGFDEISVTNELCGILNKEFKLLEDWIFLFKAHPNQNLEEIIPVLQNFPFFKLLDSSIDTNICIYYSDVIIGLFSSILIEAEVLEKPVLRYLPSKFKKDPLKELNIGAIVNKHNFIQKLNLK